MATYDGGSQRRRLPEEMRDRASVRSLSGNPRRSGSYRGGQGRYQGYDAPPQRNGSQHRGPSDYGRPNRQASSSGERRQTNRNPRQVQDRSASRPSSMSRSQGHGSVSAVGVLKSIGSAIGGAFLVIWDKSKVAALAIIAVLLIVILWLVSLLMPHDHIADGVHVGDVDVSGMTVLEAADAIDEAYIPRLGATTVYVFADEDTANSADIELKLIESEAQAEQLSFEEAQRNKKLWIASAESLGAWMPSQELAQEALDLGNNMGTLERFLSSPEDLKVVPAASFDDHLLGDLIDDINSSLGAPVVNYDLDIEADSISIKPGEDGFLLDNGEFESRLSDVLLVDESDLQGFVADIHQTHYVIDEPMAEATKRAIESRIPESVDFVAEGKTSSFDRATLMKWVATRVSEVDGAWYLEPYLDPSIASPDILKAVNLRDFGNDIRITYDVSEDGSVGVHSSEDVSLPNIDAALSDLDSMLFGSYRKSREPESEPQEISIDVNMSAGKSQFSLEEALSYGLVTEISSFTTQFANTSSTANRTENIHLVSDAIDKSVVAADGGQWSFLEHAGSMEEEDGYKEAGVIISGKMDQGIGGGVCQVATTVFNAAYEAGFGINERHNHTLYSSSYPAGLDAAITNPSLDLIWTNPTSSEVLLVTSYTDYSVTVTLIGIDPEYEVITERGDWVDGQKHKTEYEVDENLAPGASYIKTTPTEGMEIGVTRIVKDKDGNEIDEDLFYSVYEPVNRVIAYGKGSDLSEIKEKYAENDDE